MKRGFELTSIPYNSPQREEITEILDKTHRAYKDNKKYQALFGAITQGSLKRAAVLANSFARNEILGLEPVFLDGKTKYILADRYRTQFSSGESKNLEDLPLDKLEQAKQFFKLSTIYAQQSGEQQLVEDSDNFERIYLNKHMQNGNFSPVAVKEYNIALAILGGERSFKKLQMSVPHLIAARDHAAKSDEEYIYEHADKLIRIHELASAALERINSTTLEDLAKSAPVLIERK